MSIFRFSVGSDAKNMAVPCVFAIGGVCWDNCFLEGFCFFYFLLFKVMSYWKSHGSLNHLQASNCFYLAVFTRIATKASHMRDPFGMVV